MSPRRRRESVELASDIGAKAFDLYAAHGDQASLEALSIVARVNPEIMRWLRDRLIEATPPEPPEPPDSHDPGTRIREW